MSSKGTAMKKTPLAVVLLLALLAPVGAQTGEDKAAPAELTARFQAELDRLRQQHGFPGATAAFVLSDGSIGVVATGWADPEREVPMRPDSVLLAGSVGKSFVAAVVLELASEGRLGLDDKIEKWFGKEDWFARFPNGRDITVRMLLNHSSGLGEHLSQDPLMQAFLGMFKTGADWPYTHEQMMQALAGTEAQFPAGQGFAYSDTNYIVLGLIIERVTGESYYRELEQRVLAPQELSTVTPADRREIPGLAVGHMPEGNRFGFPLRVAAEEGRLLYDPSLEWTGGGLAASSGDVARWAWMLYGGRLLEGPYVSEMVAAANGDAGKLGFQYGLGIQLMKMAPGKVYGHGGWMPGYTAGMYYFPEHDFAVAIQINAVDRGYTGYADALAAVVAESLK